MPRQPIARLLPVVAVIAVAVAVAVALMRGPQQASTSYTVSANGWVLPRLDGKGSLSLGDFRGKPLVVDFFASWCTACRDELPELAAVSRKAGAAVVFVGIDSEENGDGLAMARRYGIAGWPLARDVGGSQESGLRDAVASAPGMPVIAFYDAGGRMVESRLGAVSGDTVAQLLKQHFGVTIAS